MRHGVTMQLLEFVGLLLALQIKHLFADFFLQTAYMIRNRRRYGHPGGLAHVGVHAAGSIVAFFPFGTMGAVLAMILIVEAVVHYHIDWAKDRIVLNHNLTPDQRSYWFATGTDQALHQLTYVAMAMAWFAWGPG